MKKYLILAALALGALVGFHPAQAQAATCPLMVGSAYKTATHPAVYYINENCTKMHLTPEQYFSYFTSWNDTKVTSQYLLSRVKDHTGAAVFGPHYFPRTGSLVKSPTSDDVYYVIFFTKNKIASEHVFQAMGFDRTWVETVPQSTIDKLVDGDVIETVGQVFDEGMYLFRYSDTPAKIHLLLPDIKTGKMLRHHLKNDALVDYVGYRRDRVPVLPPVYQFQIGAPIENIGEFFTKYFSDAFANVFGGLGEEFTSDFLDEEWDNMDDESWDELVDPYQETDDFTYSFAPVDPDVDHIRGNENAKITLIEYADLECPFCKNFHGTMKQVMEKYGNDVRWVYRHFPLESIHTQAKPAALATECAAEQGKFWEFTDFIFSLNLSETKLDAARLSQMATQVGIDAPTFNSCYESEKYKNLVDVHSDDAWMAGANGTPYTLVVGPNGEVKAVHGAVSFETLEEEILKLL